MIRAVVALYAFGLLAFPVWGLLSPDAYRADLADSFSQAEAAEAAQLQMAAGIHFLKNAYLAFVFLLLARYVGNPQSPGDVKRAGILLAAFPLVLMAYQGLAQIALSVDTDNLDISLALRASMLLYCILGLVLIGIARTITTSSTATSEDGAEP